MKIERLQVMETEASERANWLFINLYASDGFVGLGEASQSPDDGRTVALLHQLGKQLKGEDPTDVKALWHLCAELLDFPHCGRAAAVALGAVDQALWDLAGGTLDRSSNGFGEAARRAVAAGFTAVKSTPFDEVDAALPSSAKIAAAEAGLERLWAAREAIGPEVDLLVDCHQRFDFDSAMEIASQLEPLDLFWFEEPVPDTDVEALAKISRESKQRIAGGEMLCREEHFARYVDSEAVHILMPDIKYAGGLTPCLEVARRSASSGIPVSPHNPSGPVSTAASAHLAAAIGNFLILEYAFGEVEWREQLVSPKEKVVASTVELTHVPGLGIDFNRQTLSAHLLSSFDDSTG